MLQVGEVEGWRRLVDSDRDAALNFLKPFLLTTFLYIYSTISKGSLTESNIFGYFEQGQLTGIVGIGSNGNVNYQFADSKEDLFNFFDMNQIVKTPGLILGCGSSDSLVQHLSTKYTSRPEYVFRLSLGSIAFPQFDLANCEQARPDDVPPLTRYRAEFESESFGNPIDEAMLDRSQTLISSLIESDSLFVLRDGSGLPVAMCNISSSAEGIASIGGVYVPPSHRGKSLSLPIVAYTVLQVQQKRFSDVILFTQNPPAMRVYQKLGFTQVGELTLAFSCEN